MGWLGAVDVMQSMARRLVFDTCRVPPEADLRKDQELPDPDVAVVCMDGFDYLERVNLLDSAFDVIGPKGSKEVSDFVDTCRKLGLIVSVSKSLIRGLRANTLGGEIDGVTGKISHSREKSFKFTRKALALLSLDSVSQTSLQHWAGLFCFGAGFRRLFSIAGNLSFHSRPLLGNAGQAAMP